jgi:hypothetical protein
MVLVYSVLIVGPVFHFGLSPLSRVKNAPTIAPLCRITFGKFRRWRKVSLSTLGRMSEKGRISSFRGGGGKVCNRRNLVVAARTGEGPFTHPFADARTCVGEIPKGLKLLALVPAR